VLEVGSTRLLVSPVVNEASRGFPFPLLPRVARLKEGLVTRPPNHVDILSVSEVDLPVRDGGHRTLCAVRTYARSCLKESIPASDAALPEHKLPYSGIRRERLTKPACRTKIGDSHDSEEDPHGSSALD
jgi:hypothetical protein